MTTATLPLPAKPIERGFPSLKGELVEMHLGIADSFFKEWKEIVHVAIRDDRIEELYSMKEDIRKSVAIWIEQLDHFIHLCLGVYQPKENDRDLSILAGLQNNRRRLVEFSESVFPLWTSPEDFNQVLNEAIAIPNEELAILARKYPPPREWLEIEEVRPW